MAVETSLFLFWICILLSIQLTTAFSSATTSIILNVTYGAKVDDFLCDMDNMKSLNVNQLVIVWDSIIVSILGELVPFHEVTFHKIPSDPWCNDIYKTTKH